MTDTSGRGLYLGYGTNGFANHRLDDALRVIADLGYSGVALTLDHAHLDPFADDLPKQVRKVAATLGRLGLGVVVETGARYLLDPRRKHQPTLLADDPRPRIDFLRRAVWISAELGAECTSFWSGVREPEVPERLAWERMRSGVAEVLAEAARRGVRLGLEPEPGHLVERLDQAIGLRGELDAPELLGITLDVGHCVAVEPVDAATCVRRAGSLLFNVQLDDMHPGVHEHLEFGEGELDLPGTLAALVEIGYPGLAAVELPRHSHAAPDVAARSLAALRAALAYPAAEEPDRGADHPWLLAAERSIRTDPVEIRTLFPAAGRAVGRGLLAEATDPDGFVRGTVDDLARARMLRVLSQVLESGELAREVEDLYRYGDGAERRGVLRGLAQLPESFAAAGTVIVQDALRTNDVRLVAAAMGPFAARHLDQHGWRHGVLKCLFVGVPLDAVAGLAERTDQELVRMVSDYAGEREAAGRDVPADAARILEGAR